MKYTNPNTNQKIRRASALKHLRQAHGGKAPSGDIVRVTKKRTVGVQHFDGAFQVGPKPIDVPDHAAALSLAEGLAKAT